MTRYIIGIRAYHNKNFILNYGIPEGYTEGVPMFVTTIPRFDGVGMTFMCFDMGLMVEKAQEAFHEKKLPFNTNGVWQASLDIAKRLKDFDSSKGVWVSEITKTYWLAFRQFLYQLNSVSPTMTFDDIPQHLGRDLKFDELFAPVNGAMMIVDGSAYVRVGEATDDFVDARGCTVVAHRSGVRGNAECALISFDSRFTNCRFECMDVGKKGKEAVFGIQNNTLDDSPYPMFSKCNFDGATIKFLKFKSNATFDGCSMIGANLLAHPNIFDTASIRPDVRLKGCMLLSTTVASVNATVDKSIGSLHVESISTDLDYNKNPVITVKDFDDSFSIKVGAWITDLKLKLEYADSKKRVPIEVNRSMTQQHLDVTVESNYKWGYDETVNLKMTKTDNLFVKSSIDYPIRIHTVGNRDVDLETDRTPSDVFFDVEKDDGKTMSLNGDSLVPELVKSVFGRFTATKREDRNKIIGMVVKQTEYITDKDIRMKMCSRIGKFLRLFYKR